MKKQFYKNLIHGAIILFLFTGIANAQTAPGGVSTSASTTYGMSYTLYNNAADTPALKAQSYGSLIATGYTNSMWDLDDRLVNKISATYTLVGKGTLTIINAGTYSFSMQSLDDYAVIVIDGINYAYVGTTSGGGKYTSYPLVLSAGTHSIEIRWSQNGGGAGGETCEPQWKDNGSLDAASTSFVRIPDSKFTMTAKISNWYKADAGVTGSDGNPVTAWADQSGNTNLTNLTAVNGPIYQVTSNNQFNFNPCISLYNAFDRKFKSASYANNLAWSNQGQTMIAVSSQYTITTPTGYNQFLVSYGDDQGNTTEAEMFYGTNIRLNFGFGGAGGGTALSNSGSMPFTAANQQGISTGTTVNYNILPGNTINQYFNGSASLGSWPDGSSTKNLNNNADFWVGEEVDQTGGGYNGNIAEVINYPWVLSAAELLRVHSYLAIKYGIWLNSGTTDYVFSDATQMWTLTNNTGYINDIAGIVRDDISALYQNQSQSVNANSFVTLGLGSIYTTNALNIAANSISADKSSLVWSANIAGSPTLQDANQYRIGTQGFNTILNKRWKVEQHGTGLTGKTIQVGISNTNGIIPATNSYLIVSTTGAFNASNETYYALTTSGSYLVANVPASVLANATYFTFGTKVIAPGGVTTNLSVWLSADSNYATGSTATWTGRNSTGYKVTQSTTAKQPSVNATGMNFNPSLTFASASSQEMNSGSTIPKLAVVSTNSTAGASQFLVFNPTTVSGNPYNFAANSGSVYVNGYNLSSPGTLYINNKNYTSASLTPTAGSITLFSSSANNSQSGNAGLNGNISSIANGGSINSGGTTPLNVGSGGGGNYFNGGIGELIIYSDTLGSLSNNMSRINSYLAIKYGITLGTAGSPVNYINTKSATVWTGSTGYQNNIAGIGYDGNETLNQKQSRSVNKGDGTNIGSKQVTIGLGSIASSNAANTNTFSKDTSFLIWGDNGLVTDQLATWVSNGNPATGASTFTYNGFSTNVLMKRVWQVQATNFAQQVQVSVVSGDIIGSVLTTGCRAVCLITASDAAFTSNVQATALSVGTNDMANFTFPTGTSYFTFGLVQVKPSGQAYLPTPTNPVTTTTESNCPGLGYYYYYLDGTATSGPPGPNQNDGTQKIFAIHPEGNLSFPTQTITGTVTYQSTPFTHTSVSGYTCNIMGRLLTITDPNTGGSYTTNGGVRVRIYYSPTELTNSLVSSPLSQKWFKFEGNAAAVQSANNGQQIVGAKYWNAPDSSGTEDGVSFVEFWNITSFSTFGFASSTGANPLAVTLDYFNASVQNCNVVLNWKSATEENFKNFQVEFSSNGASYNSIYTVAGKGSNSTYSYSYAAPAGTGFYRLKMTDLDGSVKYSQILTVQQDCAGRSVSIYPNPASNTVSVNIEGYGNSVTGHIYNMIGQVLKTVSLQNGTNTLNCSGLPSGTYNLSLTDNAGKTSVHKIVVVH
ncbi:MAG: T9SS type A sorting domain-containing protein [Bacteroidetes bacterium]|nr:T9SS type A sorting domain-containing protein [Bacteroidota bacterium]